MTLRNTRQGLTFLAYIAPVHVMEVESAPSRFPDEFLGVVRSEGSVATQQDIGDDTVHTREMLDTAHVNDRSRIPDTPEIHRFTMFFA